jgi:plastocyanin
MKKSLKLGINLAVVIATVSLGLGILYNPVPQNQNALGAYNTPTNPSSTSSNNPSTSMSPNVQSSVAGTSSGAMNGTNGDDNSIALSVKQDGGVYKWTNATSGVENPELNMKTKVNNTILIQNPTDTKHELVIESQGKEVATSGDIAPGASGQASFRPNGTGLFSYHCEYHPDTMKGTITLTGP